MNKVHNADAILPILEETKLLDMGLFVVSKAIVSQSLIWYIYLPVRCPINAHFYILLLD